MNINPTNMIPRQVAEKFWHGRASGLAAWDILTPNLASSDIGEFAIVMPGEEDVVLTKEMFVFRVVDNSLIDPFYLFWALCLRAVREQWRRIVLMQANREDCGDRYREIVPPMPSSKEWARVTFKRLWWAGSRSKFTAVDWRGDYSQVGGFAPNYWANVVHALKTASALAGLANALPGERIMLAHSLGNVLTSEACKYHALAYSKYFMLNAAVPAEAYDAGQAEFDNMTPTAWKRYPKSFRSSDWHKLFESDDGRCALTWRGRYANLANAVNCHSPTEDVLANVASGLGSAWSAQELLKGMGTLSFMPRVASEAGWWFNQQHTVPLSKDELLKTEFTPDEMKTSPPFSPFADKWLHTTNAVAAAQVADVLPRILADGIPATTFAAGANETGGCVKNLNYHSLMANEAQWPEQNKSGQNIWKHSAIKNLAYPFVHLFFDELVKGKW